MRPPDEPSPRCPRCGSHDVDTHPTIYYPVWCDHCGALEYDPDTGEVIDQEENDRAQVLEALRDRCHLYNLIWHITQGQPILLPPVTGKPPCA